MKIVNKLSVDKFRDLAHGSPRFISILFIKLQMPIEDTVYYELWDTISTNL